MPLNAPGLQNINRWQNHVNVKSRPYQKKTLSGILKDIMQKHTLTQLRAIQQNNFMLSF